jgi:hypothetical protein
MYSEFVHISKIIPNVRWTFVEGTTSGTSDTSDTNNSNKLMGKGFNSENIVIQKLTSGTVTFNTINWLDLCVDTFKIVLNS